jgi:hypothetical protein
MKFSFGLKKIQKVQYIYILPIPVDLVKNMKICKGDSLNFEMLEDNSLRIVPN